MLDKFRWNLISPGDTVLAAVSGGPDSLCLLHLLWTARDTQEITVEAAHLDHGLRGAESAAEADWVADWCRQRGIACHLGREDVKAFAAAHKWGKQESARAVRYEFLERTAESIGADKIATGHTQNDQVETVLANILRGTGLDGLRGIPAKRGPIVRPLIGVTRDEIEAYCTENGLLPRRDLSNDSPDHYTRNRLRLGLLPELRQEYNPRVDEALLRLSEIAARDTDYLAAQAAAAFVGAVRSEVNGRLEMDRSILAGLHPALLPYVLRQAIERIRGSNEGISFASLELVHQAIVAEKPRGFALMYSSPACTVKVTHQRVTVFISADEAEVGGFYSASLPIPGKAALPEAGWTITASWTETPGAVRVNANAVDLLSLVVRNRQVGDKIDPLGMGGQHKKVSDIFTDAKVPRPERERVPIVADRHGIVWIVGLTLAERAKVTAETAQILYLSAQKASPDKIKQEIASEAGNTQENTQQRQPAA